MCVSALRLRPRCRRQKERHKHGARIREKQAKRRREKKISGKGGGVALCIAARMEQGKNVQQEAEKEERPFFARSKYKGGSIAYMHTSRDAGGAVRTQTHTRRLSCYINDEPRLPIG